MSTQGAQTRIQHVYKSGESYHRILQNDLLHQVIFYNRPDLIVNTEQNVKTLDKLEQYLLKNKVLNNEALQQALGEDCFTVIKGLKKMMQGRISSGKLQAVEAMLEEEKRQAGQKLRGYFQEE